MKLLEQNVWINYYIGIILLYGGRKDNLNNEMLHIIILDYFHWRDGENNTVDSIYSPY